MQLSLDNEVISTQLFQKNYHSPINLSQYTKPNFTSLHTLVTENKPYTPITCVLQRILTTTHLRDLEKLYYMLADSLSLINYSKGKQLSITLSARQWAKNLGCSKTEIFSMQKSLEDKGYFSISRSVNEEGKNKRNVITPTLPDKLFGSLANTPNRFSIDLCSPSRLTSATYIPHIEGKRAYLDRTKMFIKLNYDLLLTTVTHDSLTTFAKVIWLGFYATGYRYYHLKHKDCDKSTTDQCDMIGNHSTNIHQSYILTTTYQELQNKYSCSKSVISKTLKTLETSGFISKQRFFVKNDDEDSNLHDKSIWRITVTLPDMIQQHLQNEVKDRAKSLSRSVVSNSDLFVVNSSQYINKYFISNTKNLDNIDSEKIFSKKLTFLYLKLHLNYLYLIKIL